MRPLSFRTRILLVVIAGALLPLALVGLWLTRTAARSGEELLSARVAEALDRTVAQIGARWIRLRSDILLLAEDDVVQRALTVPPRAGAVALPTPAALAATFASLDPAVQGAVVRDTEGRVVFALERAEQASLPSEPSGDPLLLVELGIHDRASGRKVGMLDARLKVSSLMGDRLGALAASGAVLGVFERASGAALLPLPFDAAATGERFLWTGDEWITQRRTLEELPLELIAAAPLGPFTQPFEQAARRGAWALVLVAAVGLAAAAAVSGRMTSSLEQLAVAADAVSHGDLERKVESVRSDEVGRVARSFNAMTESLRGMLRQLSQREALAAVGEFASTLAHEIRNPLTSIRVDLQMVEEALPEGSELRALQSGALQEIARLDRTVSGALVVARSGRIAHQPLDLCEPLRAALHAARPAFAARTTHLAANLGDDPVMTEGDSGALEQLFLNLLLNAAQALEAGACARLQIREEHDEAVVVISDTGRGIPPDMLPHVFEPFFSTKADGTGLGLAVAQRIAIAHHGEVRIDSQPGEGTTVEVRLPLKTRVPA